MNKQIFPTTVGRYSPEGNGSEERIIRAPYGQGFIYKNWKAFATNPSAVCYIPELSDETYSQNNFISMCGGNKSLAEELFSSVDWQRPEILMDEWIRDGEVTKCKECGQFFNCYDEHVCPNCGATDELPIVTKGLSVWYVDTDSGEIEEGKVFSAYYKDGKLDSFSVEFKGSKDFDEFFGSAWGDCFFLTKEQAVAALRLKKTKP